MTAEFEQKIVDQIRDIFDRYDLIYMDIDLTGVKYNSLFRVAYNKNKAEYKLEDIHCFKIKLVSASFNKLLDDFIDYLQKTYTEKYELRLTPKIKLAE